MPYVKPISGHTRLGGAQRYLEREGRALARDFLNMDAPQADLGMTPNSYEFVSTVSASVYVEEDYE